ncbi:MAG: CHAT domain-containing protein [Acidobacteria bacterium]|nr:CHAT domain-containing protein [Acidobacteriota bacterium]
MSLWEVPDEMTRDLMMDFYERVLRDQPRAQAVRAAQLAMRRQYRDPSLWAGFVCLGDPGPLLSSIPRLRSPRTVLRAKASPQSRVQASGDLRPHGRYPTSLSRP